jgi:hypothetical protein
VVEENAKKGLKLKREMKDLKKEISSQVEASTTSNSQVTELRLKNSGMQYEIKGLKEENEKLKETVSE